MTNRKRTTILLAAAAAIAASCSKIEPITAPSVSSGRADFSVIAALGTSITAGYQSGGLVSRHQTHSYAVLFAQQVGARAMDLPLYDSDGKPPLLEIKHLFPPPIQIGAIDSPEGQQTQFLLPTAYHNMGIPGARVQDVFDTTRYQIPPRDTFFSDIQRMHGSLARQVAEQIQPPPTFLLFEFGSSELLRPALNGTAVGLTSVAAFADSFGRALDTLAALLPNTKLAVVNVPDVTALPFFTTVSNKELDAQGRPVLDANGRPKLLLGVTLATDLVLLTAFPRIALGYGYRSGDTSYVSGSPVAGNGFPLTDAEVLSNSEALTIQDRARRFNSIIDTTATSRAKPRDFAIADLHGLLQKARSPGIELRRVLYTTTFVTGGLISLDGVHPNDIAHALLCNEVIRAVNARFGASIPPVDPLRFATFTASRALRPGEEGPPPRLSP